MATMFTARYDDYCRSCYEDILEGDEVGYDDDRNITCKLCLDQAEQEEQAVAPVSTWKNRINRPKKEKP